MFDQHNQAPTLSGFAKRKIAQRDGAESEWAIKMQIQPCQTRIRGQELTLPSIQIRNCCVISTGKWLRTAQLLDEELVEETEFLDPIALVSELRQSPLPADVFTFSSGTKRPEPTYNFPFEWDNLAVVSTKSFEKWWNGLPQESRKNVRLACKRGVELKAVAFNDSLVRGIKAIYDEVPVRQGRKFWHYHKDLDAVRIMMETYLERSQFIGAFLNEQLIGFVKYTRVDDTAVLTQILAMEAHRDKRPINALLAKTIELCVEHGLTALTYGKFDYGVNKNSSLMEFKRRNGFTKISFPRYFVPLTLRGKVAVFFGMHRGILGVIPLSLTTFLQRSRSRLLRFVHQSPRRSSM